jgi:hypothetical protein
LSGEQAFGRLPEGRVRGRYFKKKDRFTDEPIVDSATLIPFVSFYDIPTLTLEEYKTLFRQNNLSFEESVAMKKFRFISYVYETSYLDHETIDSVWTVYYNHPEVFRKLSREMSYSMYQHINTEGAVPEVISKIKNQTIALRALCMDLGISTSFDWDIIPRERIETMTSNMNSKVYFNLIRIFELKPNKNRKCETVRETIGLINGIFRKMGVTKLKTTRPNGKSAYDFMKEYIDPEYELIDVGLLRNGYNKTSHLKNLIAVGSSF